MEEDLVENSLSETQKKPISGSKKVIKIIVVLIVILIIFGLVIDLVLVYQAAQNVDVTPKKIDSLRVINAQKYEIEFTLILSNPSDTPIHLEKIKYDVYIENEYIGNGEKSNFMISPGDHDQSFYLQFNIFDLTTAIQNQLLSSKVVIKVVGEVIIPIKLFNSIKVGEAKGEFELNEDISKSI